MCVCGVCVVCVCDSVVCVCVCVCGVCVCVCGVCVCGVIVGKQPRVTDVAYHTQIISPLTALVPDGHESVHLIGTLDHE